MREFLGISLLGSLVIAWAAHGWHRDSTRAAGFEQVAVRDTEAAVIARLGPPDRAESAHAPFLRYAASPCAAPCSRRLWWEHAFLPGIEAWSVELDDAGRVLRTTHWVSP